MKIEGREIEKKIERKYPYFGRQSHLVVMFVSKNSGIAIGDDFRIRSGDFNKDWVEELFEPIPYTATFTSENNHINRQNKS